LIADQELKLREQAFTEVRFERCHCDPSAPRLVQAVEGVAATEQSPLCRNAVD
jgi:hypothetical protein